MALDLIIHNGQLGVTYLVSSENEISNIDVVKMILGILDAPDRLIEYVSDRPGHDSRYALNPKKIRKELGWFPKNNFEDALKRTITHYQENVHKYTRVIHQ